LELITAAAGARYLDGLTIGKIGHDVLRDGGRRMILSSPDEAFQAGSLERLDENADERRPSRLESVMAAARRIIPSSEVNPRDRQSLPRPPSRPERNRKYSSVRTAVSVAAT